MIAVNTVLIVNAPVIFLPALYLIERSYKLCTHKENPAEAGLEVR
jgi:hypothetical protein